MEWLLAVDQQLFFLINHLPHNGLLNTFFLGLSGVGTGGLIWFLLGLWLFLKEEKKDHWFFVPIVLAGVIAFLITDWILKPLVARARPAVEMGAFILGSPSTDYAFPSGHATIAFAMAVVLSKKEPKWRVWFYVLATAIAFSRIYIGKHYPFDVIGGGFIGIIIGWLSLMLASFVHPRSMKG